MDPDDVVTPDPAKEALARARSAARTSSESGFGSRSRSSGSSRQPSVGTGRDPVLLGDAVDGMVVDRGWQQPTALASVNGRWPDIVGADVAAHVEVESFDPTDGSLLLRAESTAWATQMRLLLPTLMARLTEEVGSGVVKSVSINGPTAPSWKKGPRSVPGRGPRDTYG